MEFEVRLIDGAMAVVGEEVTFKEENGKLLALNEDSEAFGVVPNKYAEQLKEFAEQNSEMDAIVVAHGDGVSTIRVTGAATQTAQSDAFQTVTTAQVVGTSPSPKEVHAETSPKASTPSKESKEKQSPPSPEAEESKSSSGFMEGCAGCLTVILLLFILYYVVMVVIFS